MLSLILATIRSNNENSSITSLSTPLHYLQTCMDKNQRKTSGYWRLSPPHVFTTPTHFFLTEYPCKSIHVFMIQMLIWEEKDFWKLAPFWLLRRERNRRLFEDNEEDVIRLKSWFLGTFFEWVKDKGLDSCIDL